MILATCAERPELFGGDALLREALVARGARVDVCAWDAIDPAADPGATICLRSTWDYHYRWPEFSAWLDRGEQARARLINPLATVRWNADKIYLRELAAAGVPIPPTIWLAADDRITAQGITRALKALGASDGVLKPRVSASAFGLERIAPGSVPSASAREVLAVAGGLIQPFVPEIVTHGELSLIFIDGACTHAVRKTAADGEFRVQSDHGGRAAPTEVSDDLVRAARLVLQAVTRPWTFARVDLVESATGPLLMELELIEPELFLTPAAADRLAAALVKTASGEAAC